MGLLRSFVADTRGAAAAEMALILPAALALLFVTFDGAYYVLCEQRVVKGVRNAARYAARLDLSQYACPGGVFTGDATAIQNLASTGALSGGAPTVQDWAPGDVTIGVTCSTGQGGIYGATGGNAPVVRISARVEFPSLLGVMGFSDTPVYLAAAAESPVIGL